jgi:hypothetical protein
LIFNPARHFLAGITLLHRLARVSIGDCPADPGMPYSGYLGRGINDYHLYLPLLGQFLGGGDNYGIVSSSLGDFSYVLNDTLTP